MITTLPDLDLGQEWAIMELVCLGLENPEQNQLFQDLIQAENLSWGEILEQSIRHKLLPPLAYHVFYNDLEDTAPLVIREQLMHSLDINRRRVQKYYQEAERIINLLTQHQVKFVLTKGMSFESTLYGGKGIRAMADMDFMITPDKRDIAKEAMVELGYQMGEYKVKTGEIISHSREDIITYQLNPDHIPPFALLTHDPVIRAIRVDFANSLTWERSPYEVPVEAALEDICYQPIPGSADTQMPCFSPEYQFIFTGLHLFREAWFIRWLNWHLDVTLMKFGDMIRLWQTYRNVYEKGELVRYMETFEIVEPMLWVLEHLDRTLHTSIVEELGLGGRVDEAWLASAYVPGGQTCQWQGTMRERLKSKNRVKLFGDA